MTTKESSMQPKQMKSSVKTTKSFNQAENHLFTTLQKLRLLHYQSTNTEETAT